MYVKNLQCIRCEKKYSKGIIKYTCKCGGSLEVVYDYVKLKKKLTWKILRERPFGHWRYKELYPSFKQVVSLDEGGTSLIKSKQFKNVLFKLEYENPTGSFKDRGSTIELSQALKLKATKIVCASTGNMGASVSAYCARSNLPCEIIVPNFASKEKLAQMKNFGAKINIIKGDYDQAALLAYKHYKQGKAYLVGDYAYRGEGEKSIGFEILDKINPDYIVCPVGNGTLISSIWKAVKEMKKIGLIKKLPVMVGVQAKGCQPIVNALKTGVLTKIRANTIATAIACGNPLDGDKAIMAIEESGGMAFSFSDRDILKARRKLAKEGIDVEPSGAVPILVLDKLPQSKKKVFVLTGHGLKDLNHI